MTVLDVGEFCAPDGSWIERHAITDPGVYEAELDRIFARSWCVVGHVSQVSEAGQFFASFIGEDPVLVSRGRDDTISVVLNSCSHRGSPVCRVEQGQATSWVCPNHGWSFANDGRLLGVPHQASGYGVDFDRSDKGLVAARVEVRVGLIFASFADDPIDIDVHLGDSTFYLETIFDRYEDGVELLDGALRAKIGCNWKLAMENLGTDLQHPEFAHGAFMELWPDPVMNFMEDAEQILTNGGHPACIGRRPPPYTEADHVLQSLTDSAERREVQDWFDRTNAQARDRLGVERAEIYVFTGSVFPNLSFLPGVSAVFLLHPCGPHHTKWWSSCLVPRSAPAAVRASRRQQFSLTAGPGGMILAEDAENWSDMTRAPAGIAGGRRRLLIDRGMDETTTDPCLPGVFAPMRSEHVQRGFWMNWRRAMGQQ